MFISLNVYLCFNATVATMENTIAEISCTLGGEAESIAIDAKRMIAKLTNCARPETTPERLASQYTKTVNAFNKVLFATDLYG